MKQFPPLSAVLLLGGMISLVSVHANGQKVANEPAPAKAKPQIAELKKTPQKQKPGSLAASRQIDAILASAWKEEGIEPNALASDEVFLRRVYLDVVGRIPTFDEAEAFLNSKSTGKRAELIDELLASDGYVNHFYTMWADILRINHRAPAHQNITPFYIEWVRESLASNMPYDEFVRALLTATGQSWDNGAVGYYIRDRGMPLDNMANTVRIFLGTRLECAQCHDHPFDDWTQMDFYHMAAFSYGVNPSGSNYGMASTAQRSIRENKEMPDQRRKDLNAGMTEITRLVRNNYVVGHRSSLPKLPHDYKYDDAKPNQVIQPATMFGDDPRDIQWEDRMQVYADWMTSPENPLFTKTIANRLWTRLMGAGIYDAVDEYTSYSKATHPELIAFLEEQMIALDYDMKAYLRLILNSQVYQREATTEDIVPGMPYHFAGPVLRRMTAEQIWDSVVALVNPTPEMENWKRNQLFELRMSEQEAMQDVLAEFEEKDLVKAAARIAEVQKELKAEEEALRAKIAKAQKAKDSKRVAELNREVSRMRTRLREEVRDLVYRPGMEKLGAGEAVAMSVPDGSAIEVNAMMMDGSGTSSTELRKMQDEAEKAMIAKEMDAMGMEDSKERSAYASFRRSASRSMMRAAHLDSPAPPGHFLREFGQSDRDTIENANYDASVPQALALLNGTTFSLISNSQSVLTRNVKSAKTPAEKIDAIFVSLLSRKATEQERQAVLSHLEQRGSSIYADTAFALMNSQEFWFVQ